MPAPMTQLTEALFQKSFADCSAEDIRQLTDNYPYFAPAHLLLLRKLDPTTEAYRAQYARAQLYFHDPLVFSALLHQSDQTEPLAISASRPAPATETATTIAAIDRLQEAELEPMGTGTDDANADVALPPMPRLPDLAAPPEGDLNFEPLHTVDWFAAQGIKLSQEEIPRDQFGKQLMSFTEWLKTMKRIPGGKPTTPIDSQAEKKVEQMADSSVKEANVLTESMAEVWEKQGNHSKAASIYRKLSLLHPDKSAYFADKINRLNT